MNKKWKLAQTAELKWWQHYLKSRPPLEYLKQKKAYWRSILERLKINIRPGWEVLDLGCGPAGIFTILNNSAVDAVDPLIEQYEEKLPHFDRNDYPQVNFYGQAWETFQQIRKYDIVFCLNAINHFADLPLSIQKIANVMKPGAVLVLSVDAHNYSLLKQIFRRIPADILHPHQLSLQDYCRALQMKNYAITETVLLKKGFIFDYQVILATTKNAK